jgi:hypothetical protein
VTDPGQPQNGDPETAAVKTPAEVQRELHWSERWRDKFPQGTRRGRWYESFFLPIKPPTRFTEDHDELVARLTPPEKDGEPDEERAKEILEEAQATYQDAEDRREGAERRATTLQGAVAIAASLLLAGGALLADPSKVRGDGWRIAFALDLVAVTFCLVAAGARALATTSRIHVFHAPTPTNILQRSQMPLAQARIDLAAETLKDYGYNSKVADWKVAHLRASAEWFSRALVALLIFTVLVSSYVVFAPESPSAKPEAKPPATG